MRTSQWWQHGEPCPSCWCLCGKGPPPPVSVSPGSTLIKAFGLFPEIYDNPLSSLLSLQLIQLLWFQWVWQGFGRAMPAMNLLSTGGFSEEMLLLWSSLPWKNWRHSTPKAACFNSRVKVKVNWTNFQMQTWNLSVTHTPVCFACNKCYHCIISHWFTFYIVITYSCFWPSFWCNKEAFFLVWEWGGAWRTQHRRLWV